MSHSPIKTAANMPTEQKIVQLSLRDIALCHINPNVQEPSTPFIATPDEHGQITLPMGHTLAARVYAFLYCICNGQLIKDSTDAFCVKKELEYIFHKLKKEGDSVEFRTLKDFWNYLTPNVVAMLLRFHQHLLKMAEQDPNWDMATILDMCYLDKELNLEPRPEEVAGLLTNAPAILQCKYLSQIFGLKLDDHERWHFSLGDLKSVLRNFDSSNLVLCPFTDFDFYANGVKRGAMHKHILYIDSNRDRVTIGQFPLNKPYNQQTKTFVSMSMRFSLDSDIAERQNSNLMRGFDQTCFKQAAKSNEFEITPCDRIWPDNAEYRNSVFFNIPSVATRKEGQQKKFMPEEIMIHFPTPLHKQLYYKDENDSFLESAWRACVEDLCSPDAVCFRNLHVIFAGQESYRGSINGDERELVWEELKKTNFDFIAPTALADIEKKIVDSIKNKHIQFNLLELKHLVGDEQEPPTKKIRQEKISDFTSEIKNLTKTFGLSKNLDRSSFLTTQYANPHFQTSFQAWYEARREQAIQTRKINFINEFKEKNFLCLVWFRIEHYNNEKGSQSMSVRKIFPLFSCNRPANKAAETYDYVEEPDF